MVLCVVWCCVYMCYMLVFVVCACGECEFLLCVRVCFLSAFYVCKRAPVCILSRKWKNKGDKVQQLLSLYM